MFLSLLKIRLEIRHWLKPPVFPGISTPWLLAGNFWLEGSSFTTDLSANEVEMKMTNKFFSRCYSPPWWPPSGWELFSPTTRAQFNISIIPTININIVNIVRLPTTEDTSSLLQPLSPEVKFRGWRAPVTSPVQPSDTSRGQSEPTGS